MSNQNKYVNSSILWQQILELPEFQRIDLATFKSEGANSRIAQYNSKTHGVLFLKNILLNMASSFDEKALDLLRAIPHRHLGGGLSINFEGINSLDLDYLMALEELVFLENTLKSSRTILEIGAGYGRTCHSILSTLTHIEKYTILDFPAILSLSSAYLSAVSSEENFSKIKFIPIENIADQEYDLIINIDSMQEMDEHVALDYLKYVHRNGKFFYSKNTVGKFDPSLCGWSVTDASIAALESGLLRDVIDIFSPKDLALAQERFLAAFTPSSEWALQKHGQSKPWSHYYQALYKKNA